MPKYILTARIIGTASVEVDAETEADAIEVALLREDWIIDEWGFKTLPRIDAQETQ